MGQCATILNRGVEFSVKSRNLIGEFQWTTELNFARNYNELEDIGNYTPDAVSGGTNDSRVIPGSPVGSFYLMEFSHVDSETGLPVYLDRAGNETFDYDNNERKYVGDGPPDFVGGMTNTFRYKRWDLRALATFSYGAKIFDSSSKRQLGVVTSWNMRTEILDRWRQPGDEATFPRLTLDETTYGLPRASPGGTRACSSSTPATCASATSRSATPFRSSARARTPSGTSGSMPV